MEYRHFFQERYTDDQQVHGKVFNISNYQKNANQNLKEVSPHTGQNGYHQKDTITSVGENMEKRNTYALLIQPLWKKVWQFIKKLKREMPYSPAIPLLGIYTKEMKTGT